MGDALDARDSRIAPERSVIYAACVFQGVRKSPKFASEGLSHIEVSKMSFSE